MEAREAPGRQVGQPRRQERNNWSPGETREAGKNQLNNLGSTKEARKDQIDREGIKGLRGTKEASGGPFGQPRRYQGGNKQSCATKGPSKTILFEVTTLHPRV